MRNTRRLGCFWGNLMSDPRHTWEWDHSFIPDDIGCDCCPPTNLGFGIKVSIAAVMGILAAILLL